MLVAALTFRLLGVLLALLVAAAAAAATAAAAAAAATFVVLGTLTTLLELFLDSAVIIPLALLELVGTALIVEILILVFVLCSDCCRRGSLA